MRCPRRTYINTRFLGGRKLEHRTALVEQYAESVADRIVEFNKTLAEKMANALNTRKKAIAKAEQELAATELPRVHNPAHAETAIKLERLLRGLGTHMTGGYGVTVRRRSLRISMLL